MYLDSLDKKECTGCTACASVCAHKAITMEVDNEGFKYPVANHMLCVDCRLCRNSCPVAEPDYTNSENPLVYASYLKDKEQRKRSSSGGLFYAIASKVIEKDGIVYGAIMDENCKVYHKGAETLEELEALRGSKYVQSDMGATFIDVRSNLRAGRQVYFVGTPCQVAGLKKFLRKGYDNLYTSDLVCHGVPSQKLLDLHIQYQEQKYKDKITKIQFRDNASWGVCEILDFEHRKQKRFPTFDLSPYRYSCYDCKFATIPRQGDITLADYWGVKKYFPELDASSGVSLCIINTEKRVKLWNMLEDVSISKISTLADAYRYNGNIMHSSNAPEIRLGIYEKIDNIGYNKLANTDFRVKNYYWRYFQSITIGSSLVQNAIASIKKIIR